MDLCTCVGVGEYMMTTGENKAVILNLRSGKIFKLQHENYIRCGRLVMKTDERSIIYALTICYDTIVRIWKIDLKIGSQDNITLNESFVTGKFKKHSSSITAIDILKDYTYDEQDQEGQKHRHVPNLVNDNKHNISTSTVTSTTVVTADEGK